MTSWSIKAAVKGLVLHGGAGLICHHDGPLGPHEIDVQTQFVGLQDLRQTFSFQSTDFQVEVRSELMQLQLSSARAAMGSMHACVSITSNCRPLSCGPSYPYTLFPHPMINLHRLADLTVLISGNMYMFDAADQDVILIWSSILYEIEQMDDIHLLLCTQADKQGLHGWLGLQDEAWIAGTQVPHENLVRQLGVIPTSFDGIACVGAVVMEVLEGGDLMGSLTYVLQSLQACIALHPGSVALLPESPV